MPLALGPVHHYRLRLISLGRRRLPQVFQCGPARIAVLCAAIAGAFVPILAAVWAQSLAVGTAQNPHGFRQEHVFSDERSQVDVDVFADGQSILGCVFRRVDEQVADRPGQRLFYFDQASDAILMTYSLQPALGVQPLGSAREGDSALEPADRQIVGHMHFRFVKRKLTAVAYALFKQKPDVQPQGASILVQRFFRKCEIMVCEDKPL